jgi:hypothetical protein
MHVDHAGEGPVSAPQRVRVRRIAREEEVMAKAAARVEQSSIWWVFLLEGIAALIFGGLLLTAPAATLVALAIFLGCGAKTELAKYRAADSRMMVLMTSEAGIGPLLVMVLSLDGMWELSLRGSLPCFLRTFLQGRSDRRRSCRPCCYSWAQVLMHRLTPRVPCIGIPRVHEA